MPSLMLPGNIKRNGARIYSLETAKLMAEEIKKVGKGLGKVEADLVQRLGILLREEREKYL